MQYPIVYLVLKRMRAPLILLIVAWAVSMVGLTLIPGVEVNGSPRYMTIFEAFYFVSYMATTIGFGEPPFGFTDPQRLWVSFCLYLTVISWLFAIGNIISLLQDPALKSVWKKQNFIKKVNQINRKFYIICGYGETGELLLENLREKGYQCVVIDSDPERINLLDLTNSIYETPYIQGDVSDVETLKMAGLDNPYCKAILAVTNDERTNVKIAAVTKVLHSSVKVICRVNTKENIANAKSFDTDHVINTSRLYAENISLGFRTPSIQQVTSSLLRRCGRPYINVNPLPKGHWIVCGTDVFAAEMSKFLEFEGMDFTVINQERPTGSSHVNGRGTEAVTLRAAKIEKSVGIVAGTKDDTDNLSIIMTARHLKPNLYLIAKQNQDRNRQVFQNAEIDSVMESARLLVWHAIPLITQPMLATFLRLVRHQSEDWGKSLMESLQDISETVPSTYVLKFNEKKSPAVTQYLSSGNILRLQELYVPDPMSPDKPIALPLMLIRDGKEELLPKMSIAIKEGDVFLMASSESAWAQVRYTSQHEQDFHYVIHGEEKPVSIAIYMIENQINAYKTRVRKKKAQKKKAKTVTSAVSVENKAKGK
ncbi:MAG: NAD-binding protein [Gammaproteobacteria bacterium]|nr:NAD-binding protein [Gammaproteobacteria bacterium]